MRKNLFFLVLAVAGRDFTGALCAAEGLNEMFRHSGFIKMGAYTAFTSCLAFDGADSTYSAVGLVFKLYRHHFGTIPVEVTGNCPQHPMKGKVRPVASDLLSTD
jgi:alpha-N-arabinofuranosidase